MASQSPAPGFILLDEVGEGVSVACELPALQLGVKNNSVYLLQLVLKQSGHYPQGFITGYFGKLTRAAVQNFQKDNELEPTGKVDDNTVKLLNNLVVNFYPDECGAKISGKESGQKVIEKVQPPKILPVPPQIEPHLDLLSPSQGKISIQVVIHGFGFSANNTVIFSSLRTGGYSLGFQI